MKVDHLQNNIPSSISLHINIFPNVKYCSVQYFPNIMTCKSQKFTLLWIQHSTFNIIYMYISWLFVSAFWNQDILVYDIYMYIYNQFTVLIVFQYIMNLIAVVNYLLYIMVFSPCNQVWCWRSIWSCLQLGLFSDCLPPMNSCTSVYPVPSEFSSATIKHKK